jgi:hypothetical protein
MTDSQRTKFPWRHVGWTFGLYLVVGSPVWYVLRTLHAAQSAQWAVMIGLCYGCDFAATRLGR